MLIIKQFWWSLTYIAWTKKKHFCKNIFFYVLQKKECWSGNGSFSPTSRNAQLCTLNNSNRVYWCKFSSCVYQKQDVFSQGGNASSPVACTLIRAGCLDPSGVQLSSMEQLRSFPKIRGTRPSHSACAADKIPTRPSAQPRSVCFV